MTFESHIGSINIWDAPDFWSDGAGSVPAARSMRSLHMGLTIACLMLVACSAVPAAVSAKSSPASKAASTGQAGNERMQRDNASRWAPAGARPNTAKLRKLTTVELEALLPGKTLMHPNPGGSPRDWIVGETFNRRSNPPRPHPATSRVAHSRAYWVQYPSYRSGGDYIIRDNAVCVIFIEEKIERCRSVFVTASGEYLLSTFDNPELPEIRITIDGH